MVIPRYEFTVIGKMLLDPAWPVEQIGEALMDCTVEVDPDGECGLAVSIDLVESSVEIECIVDGRDAGDGLTNAKIVIHRVCECADLPVAFEDDAKPCPTSWTVEGERPHLRLVDA